MLSGARVRGGIGLITIWAASFLRFSFAQTPDFQWNFSDHGFTNYILTSVSSTKVYAGGLPAGDPTINLIVGKRYQVTNANFVFHPLQILAKGANSLSDVVLLGEGGTVGSLEGHAGVVGSDNGAGTMQFTVTTNLVNAMRATGHTPGYRCEVHLDSMRGDFAIFGGGAPIANPIVPRIPKGTVTIELATIASGLVAPLGIALPAAGTQRIFIYDQEGRVWVVSAGSGWPRPCSTRAAAGCR